MCEHRLLYYVCALVCACVSTGFCIMCVCVDVCMCEHLLWVPGKESMYIHFRTWQIAVQRLTLVFIKVTAKMRQSPPDEPFLGRKSNIIKLTINSAFTVVKILILSQTLMCIWLWASYSPHFSIHFKWPFFTMLWKWNDEEERKELESIKGKPPFGLTLYEHIQEERGIKDLCTGEEK